MSCLDGSDDRRRPSVESMLGEKLRATGLCILRVGLLVQELDAGFLHHENSGAASRGIEQQHKRTLHDSFALALEK